MNNNTLCNSLDISFKEELTCPKCSITSDMKNSINKFNTNNPNEFDRIVCRKCSLEFCYILCIFCEKKIYMKMHAEGPKYNGMNAFNISCPYKICEKIFYFTECIKCKRPQKQKKYIKEGESIECIYEDCKFVYIQNNCSIYRCPDIFSVEKNLMFNNFPEGILSNHQNHIMHQKINCYYCWRPIVFPSSKKCINRYFECQLVECPYKDCKKSFNRIICPFCNSEIYVKDGWYEMGSEIKCNKCNKYFGKILCPTCNKINNCHDEYFQFGKMVCGFQKCKSKNYMINCIYCRKLNVFKKDIPINGQTIKCGYCKNLFNKILCPFCKFIIPFSHGDFIFGKVYKCIYINCLKKFQYLVCPNCFSYSFKSDSQEGKKIKCQNCKIKFMNWGCPFCKSNIMDKNTSLKYGQMVKCPSESCGKLYSFIRCSKCEKLIFSKENENILGISVKCQSPGCGAYTLVSHCTFCDTKTTYSDTLNNFNEGDIIQCPDPACNKKYKFYKNNEIYKDNLQILEQIEGNTINFGIPQIDENYLYKQDLFIDKRILKSSRLIPSLFTSKSLLGQKSNFSKCFEECMICHNNRKESIFYPCGHRCVCYNCAVVYFSTFRKCPKCQSEAKCIIKKVYE